ncbi:hypothetical protein HK102_010460, partial [Quaeritorhiza haematococci]
KPASLTALLKSGTAKRKQKEQEGNRLFITANGGRKDETKDKSGRKNSSSTLSNDDELDLMGLGGRKSAHPSPSQELGSNCIIIHRNGVQERIITTQPRTNSSSGRTAGGASAAAKKRGSLRRHNPFPADPNDESIYALLNGPPPEPKLYQSKFAETVKMEQHQRKGGRTSVVNAKEGVKGAVGRKATSATDARKSKDSSGRTTAAAAPNAEETKQQQQQTQVAVPLARAAEPLEAEAPKPAAPTPKKDDLIEVPPEEIPRKNTTTNTTTDREAPLKNFTSTPTPHSTTTHAFISAVVPSHSRIFGRSSGGGAGAAISGIAGFGNDDDANAKTQSPLVRQASSTTTTPTATRIPRMSAKTTAAESPRGVAAIMQQQQHANVDGGRLARNLVAQTGVEGDRAVVLAGLKENWKLLSEEYGKMPITVTTMARTNRKQYLEKQLKSLEENIERYSKLDVVAVGQ